MQFLNLTDVFMVWVHGHKSLINGSIAQILKPFLHKSIRWLHANKHLYSSRFSRFETLLRYVKPEFINPSLLDDLNILEKVLEGVAVRLAFLQMPNTLTSFPMITCVPDIASHQYPKSEHESLKQLILAKYGEKYLDCKAFSHLHP